MNGIDVMEILKTLAILTVIIFWFLLMTDIIVTTGVRLYKKIKVADTEGLEHDEFETEDQ